MEEFLKSLGSINWWLGVVFVGLLLNVLSAYLKSPIDRLLNSASKAWRNRSEASKKRSNAYIEQLRGSQELRQECWEQEIRARLQSLALTLMAVLLLILYLNQRLRHPELSITQFESPRVLFFNLTYFLSMLIFMLGARRQFAAASLASQLSMARRLRGAA